MSKLIYKILLIMTSILLSFIILFSFFFGYLFFQHSQNVEISHLESIALSLSDTLGKATRNNDLTSTYNNNILQLINTLNQGEIWLIDKNTTQVSGYRFNPTLKYTQLSSSANTAITTIFSGKNVRTTAFNEYTNPNFITIGVPIYNSDGTIRGALLLHSKLSTIKFSWYDGIALIIFCSICLLVLLLLLLKYLISKHIIPLQTLNNFIDKLIQHNYSSYIKTKSNDEISLLAQKLNQLATYLKNMENTTKTTTQSNNNLIIKTSYKLRTPLKELRRNIQELTINKNIDSKVIRQMEKNLNKLDNIATNLLDLSQLDTTQFSLKKDLLNLLEILQDSIKSRQKIAQEENISIKQEINLTQKVILFTGDKNRLKQMFCEILDKALQIYPANSNLIINITENDTAYHIYLQNDNNEVSLERLPEIFTQFYQSAEDDTITQSIELKIAQHLAALHQIKLITYQKTDNYTSFKFTIPK